MKRIPSLDGLRAIAIVMVLVSHLGDTKGAPSHHFSSLGYLGVRIFFVISGLLITRLLLNERERTGRISLASFYFRRTLRIFPAMWFYLMVLAALTAAGLIKLFHNDLLFALTYTVNYHQDRSWFIAHLWSLSVEEQFYLLWPLAVCFLDRRQATKVVVAIVAVAPLLRAAVLIWMPGAPIVEWFPTVCDELAVGCLMALIPAAVENRILAACCKPWFIAVPLLALFLNSFQYHADRHYWILYASAGQTIINCCIALTISWLVAFPRSLAGRILNSGVPVWIGTVSYSLYMWQQPFLNRDVHTSITAFPLNLIFALLMAVFSYYLVELPVLRLRNRRSNAKPARFALTDKTANGSSSGTENHRSDNVTVSCSTAAGPAELIRQDILS